MDILGFYVNYQCLDVVAIWGAVTATLLGIVWFVIKGEKE